MNELMFKKGSIMIASASSYMLQVMIELPESAEEVNTWITIGGGMIYIGLNSKRIIGGLVKGIGKLFNKKDKK